VKKRNLKLAAIALLSLMLVGCGKKEPEEPTTRYAYIHCIHYVEQRLKSPSSAEFSSLSNSNVVKLKTTLRGGKNNIKYLVTGYVDSKNSFGAKIRNNYSCKVTGETGGSWTLDNISMQ
jgi:hypothetical protein